MLTSTQFHCTHCLSNYEDQWSKVGGGGTSTQNWPCVCNFRPNLKHSVFNKWLKKIYGRKLRLNVKKCSTQSRIGGRIFLPPRNWSDSKISRFLGLIILWKASKQFKNDQCVQYINGWPAIWMPAHHCRLLYTNALLPLLRFSLRSLCLIEWFALQRGSLLSNG